VTTARSKAPTDRRPYVRSTQEAWRNPKILATGLRPYEALGAHQAAIFIAAEQGTDGVLNTAMFCRMVDMPEPVFLAIVSQNLFHLRSHNCGRCVQPAPGSFVIHDYLKHQRSDDEIKSLSEKRSKVAQLGNEARWGTGDTEDPKPQATPSGPTDPIANGIATGIANGITAFMAKPIANGIPFAMQEGSQNDRKLIADLDLDLELEVQELKTPPTPNDQLRGRSDPLPAKPGEGEDPEILNTARAVWTLVEKILEVREHWDGVKIAKALESGPATTEPWPVVEAAALAIASDPDITSPKAISADGPKWRDARNSYRPPVELPPIDPALIHGYEPLRPRPEDPPGDPLCRHCEGPKASRRHPPVRERHLSVVA
jgi:hypothetical protein